MQYLVKWRGLGYDECTWEAPSDLLPKFNEQIAKFKSQQPIASELDEKQKSRAQVHQAVKGATAESSRHIPDQTSGSKICVCVGSFGGATHI